MLFRSIAARFKKTEAMVASAKPTNRNPKTAHTDERCVPAVRSSFKTNVAPATVIRIPKAPAAVGVSFKNSQPNINARIGRTALSGPYTDKSAARKAAIIAKFPSASKTPPSKLSIQNEFGGRLHVIAAANVANGNIHP